MIFGLLFAVLTVLVGVNADKLENVFGHRQICGGVYGPGSNDRFKPQVIVNFDMKHTTSGQVGLVIYPFTEVTNIGFTATLPGGRQVHKYMCDQAAVYAEQCPKEDLGMFMVRDNKGGRILSQRIDLQEGQDTAAITLDVQETTYYCVAAEAVPGHEGMKFDVNVRFQNPYGYLPGSDYPLILYHFVQCIIYAVIMLIWTIRLIQHRHYILKLQKYITVMGYLLVLEQGFLSLYYYITNKQGQSAGAKTLLGLVAFWGSARLSYTFFLLLLVSCGYSVVHPSLGKRMFYCRILGGTLFVFSLLYFVFNYYESDNIDYSEKLSTIAFILLTPMLISMGVNYFMVLTWMGQTVAYLRSRKQTAKVSMYRMLTLILTGSMIAMMLMLFAQFFSLYFYTTVQDFMNKYWQLQWITSDGWPNIVFCVAFTLVMILWRPNSDNKRYAMSTQLAQNENDADEFEIGSLNGSDVEQFDNDEDDDDERTFGLGAQPSSSRHNVEFDSTANHELSDLEDQFEVDIEDRHASINDEDPLVDAPSSQLGKKNR